jgi:DNA-binding NarL/FixJ family response regulator
VTVRVLVVDDHPLVCDGMRFLAESCPEIEIVGEAAHADEAVAAAQRLRPDVIVMDVELAGGTGLDAAVRIRRDVPATRILFLTMHGDEATVLAALRAGASGYVVKGAHRDEVVRAIMSAAAGELILGAHAAAAVSLRLGDLDPTKAAFPQLTDREREILELMAAGRPNGQIARQLAVSPKTIANHVANIITKIHAADRGEAIVLARNAGLGRR